MQPISNSLTALQQGGNAGYGKSSATPGSSQSRSVSRATFRMIRLRSLPPPDRERSSAGANHAAAPASGLGGDASRLTSRLDEANREWCQWRFGEDA